MSDRWELARKLVISQKYLEAKEVLVDLANQGDSEAWYYIGAFHESGQLGRKDFISALDCYLNSVSLADNYRAELGAGRVYSTKEGGCYSPTLAVSHFYNAADLGSVAGYYCLGQMYLTDRYSLKDYESAKECLKISAESGYIPAEIAYGRLLLKEKKIYIGAKFYFLGLVRGFYYAFKDPESVFLSVDA